MIFLLLTILVLFDPSIGCSETDCLIENDCRCSSTDNPINVADAPQLIALTFDEAVVDNLFTEYWQPLLFDRKNPDGNPISVTFYVPHEYTDYERVQQLYVQGFEIGVHSVTKNSQQSYWRNATYDTLTHEFGDQRKIISYFANIPIEDITGGRTPQLQIEGDVTINAYIEAGLEYDNSWPTYSTFHYFPYTLDYQSAQECMVSIECPSKSHPGFWIIPITDIQGLDDKECNSLVTCEVDGTADEIAAWLLDQVNRVRNNNRSPLNLRIDSYWFQFFENSLEGFKLFLDEIGNINDIFLVSQRAVLDWIKNPITKDQFRSPTYDRTGKCDAINCELKNVNGSLRYMKSCVPCPQVYPWLGNPYGQFQTNY